MRTRSQILIVLGRAAMVASFIALALVAAVPGSARASVAAPRPDLVGARAAMRVEGLSLDSSDGLLESAAPSGREVASGASSSRPTRKNPMLAMLMSFAVPGLGELYTGNTVRARGFLSAEAGIWVGYAAFKVQEGLRTDDYEEFARVFAGVPEGSSGEYYQDVADYIRNEGADSYNEAIRAEARSLYPDDLDAQRDYLAANGYFGSSEWEWASTQRFEHYRELRHGAAISRKNAFYMTGLAILNRALSAVDSVWMARRHNMGIDGEPSARLYMSPEMSGSEVGSRLALEFSF